MVGLWWKVGQDERVVRSVKLAFSTAATRSALKACFI